MIVKVEKNTTRRRKGDGKKLNNVVDWRQEEMERAVELLDIPYEKLYAYFFTKEVEKNTTFKKEANR